MFFKARFPKVVLTLVLLFCVEALAENEDSQPAPATPERVYFRGSYITPGPHEPFPWDRPDYIPPTRMGRFKKWAHDKTMVVSDYLYDGFSTGGIGFVYRRPTDEEAKRLENEHWTRSWYEKEAPFRWRQIPRYLWPYQWPVRIATKLATGEQHLLTPGHGIADTLDRFTCSRIFQAITGGFVMTGPARFAVRLAPGLAGIVYLTEAANYGQSSYLEYRTQNVEGPLLDQEIQENHIMKGVRQSLAKKEIDRAEARRRARLLLKESEDYPRRVKEVSNFDPKDPVASEAFILWSLNLLAFKDLHDLSESRQITVDHDRYLYGEGFQEFISDEQMLQLVLLRHSVLLKLRGAETLINDVSKKNPNLKVDPAGENLRQSSRAVRAVIQSFKDGKIDEKQARKWIHVYLDFYQENMAGRELGVVKRAIEKDPDGTQYFGDNPLTIDTVENDIIARLPK